jgi:3-keto-5-aminohexanoate cleavage enzyme
MIATDKLIICVAPLGSFMGKDMNPNIPIQPDEIAEEVYRAWNAGASIVHLHARDKNGIATTDPDVFRTIDQKIREKGCDIIIQHSTSPGGELDSSVEDGLRVLEADTEMATVDIGVMVGMRKGQENLFVWSRSFVERLLTPIVEKGIKPELEIYTPGAYEEIYAMIEKRLLKKPYWISFVFDMHGTFQNVVRYSPKNFVHYVDLLPPDSMFTALGMAAAELPVAVQSILLGGHLRVGFEDNLHYSKGVLAESNAQLVERVAKIGREPGRETATPDEARELLGIPAFRT